jgi:peptidoglycan biosynthesis protein MviN/MurJ (putative lipid II flippase)
VSWQVTVRLDHYLLAFVGFAMGLVLFGYVIRWLALVFSAWVLETRGGADKPRRSRLILTVACQSLFHSAPWLAIIVAFFVYHVRSEPWAKWLLTGAGISLLMMSVFAIGTVSRMFRRKEQRDAPGTLKG